MMHVDGLIEDCGNSSALTVELQKYSQSSPTSIAYICQSTGSTLVQVMACHMVSAKPLPEPVLTYCQLDP